MAKEIIIPQGTYTVGIDFPEGTYIFDSMESDGTFDHFIKKVKGEDNKYYNLDGDVGYQIRITLKNEDYFVIEAHEKYGSRGKRDADELVKNATALFSGGQLSENDKARVLEAIQEAYFEAKIINKKYTPKKYRKNNDNKTDDNE